MRCDNCGMEHARGENKLCNGPFVYQVVYRDRIREVGSQAFVIRNQFYYRMRLLERTMTDEDNKVIDEAINIVRRSE